MHVGVWCGGEGVCCGVGVSCGVVISVCWPTFQFNFIPLGISRPDCKECLSQPLARPKLEELDQRSRLGANFVVERAYDRHFLGVLHTAMQSDGPS